MRGLISGRFLNKQATDAGLAYEAIHYIKELHVLDVAHHVREPTNLFLLQLALKTLTMDTYLDPINRKFADAAADGPPLYTKSYTEAREILENIQSYKPAEDVESEDVKVEVKGENVTTVIFRPKNAQGTLNMIFYTHGGGWILGR